jgi:circadian clock protein KaiC
MDHARSFGVTLLCTSLLEWVGGAEEFSASHISTIADTWIHVSNLARDGERNRALNIVKSRGANHSNQVRELVMSSSGIDLVDVYVAEGEVRMGAARAQKEAEARSLETQRVLEARLRRLEFDREIAELARSVQAATVALELKQRESEVVSAADAALDATRRAAALDRQDRRQPGGPTAPIDDSRPAAP